MLRLEFDEVYNFDGAIRGMRNPMNSWAKSDSDWCMSCEDGGQCQLSKSGCYMLGANDLDLCKRLVSAGTEHRKFLRQVMVSVDIIAPLYWWKEFDTYKVGTTANSTSTMHKIHAKEFTIEDFSYDHLHESENGWVEDEKGHKWTSSRTTMETIVGVLNAYRHQFLTTKDKAYWYVMVQLLPSSYNQKRTVTMNYENLLSMYFQRKNHKLEEWHTLCDWIKELPYMEEFIKCVETK